MTSTSSRDYDHLFKLVLVGDSGVGKSCLLLRFADDSFTDSYITTIGVDFVCLGEVINTYNHTQRFKTVNVNGKRIKLQIWDTAGQERFRTITSTYYRGADGIIIVYDVTDKTSFEHVGDWLSEINKYVSDDTCKLLLGNKCDVLESRDVNNSDVVKLSNETDIPTMEVSAKTSENVEKAFMSITKKLVEIKAKQEPDNNARSKITLSDSCRGEYLNLCSIITSAGYLSGLQGKLCCN